MPQTAIIPVTLSTPATQQASIDWTTSGFYTDAGSFAPGIAYVSAGGTLVWEVGEVVKNIEVTILDTAQPGYFFIVFNRPVGLLPAVGSARVTLQAAASSGGGGTPAPPPPMPPPVTPPSGLAVTIGGDVITVLGSPLTL